MIKLRIGIIGIGVIANTKHIPSLMKIAQVEIVALCDILPECCEKANASFGLNAKIYTDYRDLCSDPSVDVVHICTPNPFHCEMTLAAFEFGKHVHCEKPMACTYEDSLKMIAASKKAGKKLTVGLQWRYRDQCVYMRDLVKQGYFGDVYYMKSQQLRGRRLPAYGVYTSKEKNGGGVLMDGGPHSIDLPMWIADNYEPMSVRGVITDKMRYSTEGNALGPWDPQNFDVEDSAFALITMKNGLVIYMETAWTINMIQSAPGIVVSLAGTKAGADMVGPQMNTSIRLNQIINEKQSITVPTLGMPPMMNMNDYDITHWIDAILYDRDPAVLPEQAAAVTRVMEGIYKSAATGETIFFE
ncbi:MAG TPA: Gfo/Idh/MocA family oxidoreductase [Clostridiales bacterium]|nr:Gfo/Idh/MocA family oxidoreductase [Clostridiales bacterium]